MKQLIALVCALLLAVRVAAAPPASSVGAGWRLVPNTMADQRWAPAAALVDNGKSALIAGGYSFAAGGCVATADRYVEARGRFERCKGRLNFPRNFAGAAALPDGRVLIAGGYNTVWGTLDTVEVYEPRRDSFRLLQARLSTTRELFTATPLGDGRVLLAGGFSTHRKRTLASADIYDPATDQVVPVGSSMATNWFGHAAVRLPDGRVLLVGGQQWTVGKPATPLASAEIFDPRTGTFRAARGEMASPRDRPTAALLPNGTVLVAGGQNGSIGPTAAEVFDPQTETFSAAPYPLGTPRMAHGAVTLPDGRVLLAGGWSPPAGATTATTEIFSPVTSRFDPGPPMPQSAHDFALLVFPDGLVLAAGGKQVNGSRVTALDSGATASP